MYKRIPLEIKEEILSKVKSGESVTALAGMYAISTKTIYYWLSDRVKPEASLLEINRLKRENEELKRIIGMLTLNMERGKKS